MENTVFDTGFGVLIGAVASGLVLLINSIWSQYRDSKKNDNDHLLKEKDQAFIFYKQLVETLQKSVDQINIDMNKLEEEYISCREKCAELKIENLYLKEKKDEE